MDRGSLPVAKRTRLQTQKFYGEISGGKTSKKPKAFAKRVGCDDDVVFLGILGSGGRDKYLKNVGEAGTAKGSGEGGGAAVVDHSGPAQREMDCVDEFEKELDTIDVENELDIIDLENELDIIDVEKELTCLEVEVRENKKKKNGGDDDEALKNFSSGKRMTGLQERIKKQVSERSGNTKDRKVAGGSEKPDDSSEEESPMSSSSEEEDDDLEDEDYVAEKSSSDFVEPKDEEAAIDEVSSEDGESIGMEDVHDMAKGLHPSSESKKNKEEKKGWGFVTAPSSMWIEEEEEKEETLTLVRRSRVTQRTRSHGIAPRQGIVEEKESLGTFDNPYCLVEDDAENEVTSKKTNLAHEQTSPSRTVGSNTAASESMWDFKNVNDASETSSVVEGGRVVENAKPAHARRWKTSSDAKKVLLSSIWGEEDLRDMTREHDPETRPNSPKENKITNWLFKWGDDSPSPPEKTPDEKQMDELWMEFDFCLRTSEMEPDNEVVVESEDQNDELDPCRHGNHDGILNEEIGIRCRHCGLIMQEIRDIHAPFIDDPFERRGKRDDSRTDGKMIDRLLDGNVDPVLQSDHYVKKDGSVWDLIPGVKDSMYQHQIDGFEFIWKNLAGGLILEELERMKDYYRGSGCIISHAPGTGKTRLTIVFLQSYMNFQPKCRPVIIAPKSMLMTWEEEFRKWNVNVPFHNLNRKDLTGRESLAAVRILQKSMTGSLTVETVRWLKLQSWTLEKSVLGVSYNLFVKLTKEKGENVVEDEKSMRNTLLEKSGIVVMDEGHTPRNDESLIWKATSNIKTRKQIILSGTPFQNNFNELHNTLSLVKPGFDVSMFTSQWESTSPGCGSRKSTRTRDDWGSLTGSISKNHDTKKLDKLKSLIAPFVHVHKGTILQDCLPGMSHCALYLRPRSLQKQLLGVADTLVNTFQKKHLVTLLSVHPSMLLHVPVAENRELFPDISQLGGLKLNPEDGAKTKFIMELIRLSESLKEKVLIFSEFLDPLDFIKEQLRSCFDWIEGREILKMDGHLDLKQRQTLINSFNNEASEVRVLLASTRACSEGISLVGASRVVLLDSAWNPSVERQAISRAYRLGQKKFVYIYHLLAFGTSEEDTYRQQVEKDVLSNMIFPLTEKNEPLRPDNAAKVPEDKILQAMLQHSNFKELFEKIVYHKKEANLMETFGRQLARMD